MQGEDLQNSKLFPNQPNTLDNESCKLMALHHAQNSDWDYKSANWTETVLLQSNKS